MEIKKISSLRSSLNVIITGPEGQVIPQQLHNKGGVLVGVLRNVVQFLDLILKLSPLHLALVLVIVQDLVVEDGEVQSKTQTDGVGDLKVLGLDAHLQLILVLLAVLVLVLYVVLGVFLHVPVVVTRHLVVEDLGFLLGLVANEVVLQELENLLADLRQFVLHFFLVLGLSLLSVRVALGVLLLLNGRDDPPGSPP